MRTKEHQVVQSPFPPKKETNEGSHAPHERAAKGRRETQLHGQGRVRAAAAKFPASHLSRKWIPRGEEKVRDLRRAFCVSPPLARLRTPSHAAGNCCAGNTREGLCNWKLALRLLLSPSSSFPLLPRPRPSRSFILPSCSFLSASSFPSFSLSFSVIYSHFAFSPPLLLNFLISLLFLLIPSFSLCLSCVSSSSSPSPILLLFA